MNVKSLSKSGSQGSAYTMEQLHQDIERLLYLMEEIQNERISMGDWVSEEQIKKITGLGKTTLYNLRTSGVVSSSTISGKGVFYRRSDFERLLNENEKKR